MDAPIEFSKVSRKLGKRHGKKVDELVVAFTNYVSDIYLLSRRIEEVTMTPGTFEKERTSIETEFNWNQHHFASKLSGMSKWPHVNSLVKCMSEFHQVSNEKLNTFLSHPDSWQECWIFTAHCLKCYKILCSIPEYSNLKTCVLL